jgi:uncharacterized membrane protein
MSDAFERAADREEEEYRARRERRERRNSEGNRTAFRIHLTTYIAVQVLIVVVWALVLALGGTGHPWFLYPLLAWGVGVAAHYAAVRDRLRKG